MRWLVLTLCLVSAACSSESVTPEVEAPPDLTAAAAGLKQAAQDAKLAAPLEISQPTEAPPPSTERWIICLRSAASEESKKRIYSAFFSKNSYRSVRLSVILDRCDGQTFFPMSQ
jgi:hypothetical protein